MNLYEPPLVSIVVPVYNVERYLDGCMQSITSQTYERIEIILVDDGATDNSGAMCDVWRKKDPRVRVIHKENGGLSDARNCGTREAKGDLIVYVDSDDQIDNRLVEILFDCLVKNNVDVAICDPVHVFTEKDMMFSVSDDVKVFDSETAICEMWYQKTFLPSAWAKMYKKDLLDELEFRKGILYEDIDMMHKVFWSAKKIAYTPSRLYAYQHREGSITTNKFGKRDCEILNICRRLNEFAANRSVALQKAARAYGIVGALRVQLNAPNSKEFKDEKKRAKSYIKKNWKSVLGDKNVRKKTKIGIFGYIFCKPLMKFVYKRINRWK